jgi:hypothetical protein
VHDWLEGTTRYQMSDAQRAFWIDLLAMAGRSRFGGVVCSGKDGDKWIGYPLSKFQGLLAEPIDVEATFELFQQTEKITLQVAGQGARKLYTLFISNWAHYQSEYERKKGEKKRRIENVPSDVPTMSAGMSQSMSPKSTSTEVEGEKEVEGEREKEKEEGQRRKIVAAPSAITNSFFALGHKPFGTKKFQEIWAEEWSAAGNDPNWTDIMEQAIQRCHGQRPKVTVPGLFYKHKHEIESGEVKMRYRVTPL